MNSIYIGRFARERKAMKEETKFATWSIAFFILGVVICGIYNPAL